MDVPRSERNSSARNSHQFVSLSLVSLVGLYLTIDFRSVELESGLGDAVCEMRLPNHRLEIFRFWFLAPAMGARQAPLGKRGISRSDDLFS